ncbi:hypothetical protein L3V43_01765 [Pseudoalteromonas sp. L23]|uniref:hypothetical protein n=1 Tax=unclassified Pseudoalteromonas TaxID=194690 RepID=UPI001EF02D5E|nr:MULTISPECIES: hypothetical protein [unclassified Pseudoalteromonas]MCF7512403.1 hypothetical protein [Pseudoalteromonas sp. L7]MCF7524383.1 hypothetical protein [Pseudoalteromonas sp. L23]
MKLSTSIFATSLVASAICASHVFAKDINDSDVKRLYVLAKQVASQSISGSYTFAINCHTNPSLLKRAVEQVSWPADEITFAIQGQCQGPIKITRPGITISGSDNTQDVISAALNGVQPTVLVESGSVKLNNLGLVSTAQQSSVTVTAQGMARLDNVATQVQGTEPEYHYIVTDNSNLYLSNLNQAKVKIAGGAFAEFVAGNQAMTAYVFDTANARSTQGNQFDAVQVAGNGYFLADGQSHINLLMIWSKGAAEIDQQSSVGELMMGGQTLFAAYRNSTLSGPYSFFGNVVFELEHSSATNWVTKERPHSLFSGNNAVVNGELFPSWSWQGQAPQPE